MEIDNYLAHYEAFNKEFCNSETIDDIEDKILSEMNELQNELILEGTQENRISECIDVLNMSIKLLNAYGIKNPLMFGYLKLQQTAEKYRAQGVGK